MNPFDSLRSLRAGFAIALWGILSIATAASAQSHSADPGTCARLAASLTLSHTTVTAVQRGWHAIRAPRSCPSG